MEVTICPWFASFWTETQGGEVKTKNEDVDGKPIASWNLLFYGTKKSLATLCTLAFLLNLNWPGLASPISCQIKNEFSGPFPVAGVLFGGTRVKGF